MAQLPPDGRYLVQKIGQAIVILERYTEDVLVSWTAADPGATARAQQDIHLHPDLTDEQKCFAHFWAGYFHAYACNFGSEEL